MEGWKASQILQSSNPPNSGYGQCKVESTLIYIIWEFYIRPEKRADFERYYSSSGHWADLFRKNPDYRGTTLMKDIERPERYLVTDRWDDLAAFQNFKENFRPDYEQLDKLCEQFTEEERCLGIFQVE